MLMMRGDCEMDSAATNALIFFLVGFHGQGSLISYLDGKKRKTRKTNNAWNDNQSQELSALALFTMNSNRKDM